MLGIRVGVLIGITFEMGLGSGWHFGFESAFESEMGPRSEYFTITWIRIRNHYFLSQVASFFPLRCLCFTMIFCWFLKKKKYIKDGVLVLDCIWYWDWIWTGIGKGVFVGGSKWDWSIFFMETLCYFGIGIGIEIRIGIVIGIGIRAGIRNSYLIGNRTHYLMS